MLRAGRARGPKQRQERTFSARQNCKGQTDGSDWPNHHFKPCRPSARGLHDQDQRHDYVPDNQYCEPGRRIVRPDMLVQLSTSRALINLFQIDPEQAALAAVWTPANCGSANRSS